MSIKDIHVKSLKDALDTLESLALGNGDIVFRGHSNPDWPICSTLSRHTPIPHRSWDTLIDDMLEHFATNLRSIGALPDEIIRGRRARLEYGRHYGVPSPLIDFSLSPYVALFFAFNETRPDRNKLHQEVVVYAVDIPALGIGWARYINADLLANAESMTRALPVTVVVSPALPSMLPLPRVSNVTGQFEQTYRDFMYEPEPAKGQLFENGYPEGILKFIRFPASWNKRMQRQMGVFIYDTLDYKLPHPKTFEDFVSQLKEPMNADTGISSPILTKVFIPLSVAPEAFSKLELMGMTATMLYGDHAGAATDVANAYNYNRKTGFSWDLSIPPPDDTKM
jgi:hypothetical protein